MSFAPFHDTSFGEDELRLADQREVLYIMYGISRLPTTVCAPYREDRHPSCSLYERGGRVFFHDFATGQKGDLWDLIMLTEHTDWAGMLNMAKELKVSERKIDDMKCGSPGREDRVKIEVAMRQWNGNDMKYWNMYGLDSRWLEWADVHPISRVFMTRGEKATSFRTDALAYCYVSRQPGFDYTMKIYQPVSKIKWLSSNPSGTWDLYDRLPREGRMVTVTSSRKDALCLWAAGMPAVSPQSESIMPDEAHMEDMKRRFNRVYLLYDNDFGKERNWGQEDSARVSAKYGVPGLKIPDEYQSKDYSDLVMNWGKEKASSVLRDMIETAGGLCA